MRKTVIYLLVLGIVLAVVCPASAADRSLELERLHQQIRSRSMSVRVLAAKNITTSGIQDPQLFATINQQLRQRFNRRQTEKHYVDEMAWLCKALASSGNSDYAVTLKTIARLSESYKLRKYARQSLELIPDYAQQNQIINRSARGYLSLNTQEVRWANMIQSDNVKLKRDGAKKIIRAGTLNEELFDIINAELMANYIINTADDEHIDTMAWLCKALAASGLTKYRTSLSEIYQTTDNTKLKEHAEKALNALSAGY
ncbi:MAG: hypothetical protein J7K75_01510 [Desulfuromonas sp.]|nr:hypothetical protein [Desulfuromonas sp.]